MDRPTSIPLRIGAWCVYPATGQISRDEETARLDVRSMRLLVCLAERAGEVVSIDDLLNQVWAGVSVSQDSVYQAVTSLRRQLGDDPRQPAYIATVPRLGYRMVAPVSPLTDRDPSEVQSVAPNVSAPGSLGEPHATEPQATEPGAASSTVNSQAYGRRRRPGFTGGIFSGAGALRIVIVALCLAGGVAFLVYETINGHSKSGPVLASAPQRSIAVLPFLDLTEGMRQEEFADGMTEELIDKLSKIPGLQVPGPTSSFYFKGKQIPVAEIAKTLGVAYILDGSVRKSGARLRVAARLIRADSGYVVWTESYDRSLNDLLMVQDDIASEVTKALGSTTELKSH